MAAAVRKRRRRPGGVIWVTERREELCHVEGEEVSVSVSEARTAAVEEGSDVDDMIVSLMASKGSAF